MLRHRWLRHVIATPPDRYPPHSDPPDLHLISTTPHVPTPTPTPAIMSSRTPPKPIKAALSTGAPQPSYQDRLRYAIDLLRQSEIQKSELISKLSAAATPLPQRVKTIRRIVVRPTQNGETEEVEEEEEVAVERVEEEEKYEEAEKPSSDRSQKEEQDRRAREKEKQETHERERERGRTVREQADVRKVTSKPSSKAGTPRGSLTSPARKSAPVTPQKDETKTTPRRTPSSSSTTAVPTSLAAGFARHTASSSAVARGPLSTPPSNRTASRTKTSPPSSSISPPSVPTTRKSGGSGGKAREATTPTPDNLAAPVTQRARSTSSVSSSSSAIGEDSSILQTYVRFLLSPARLLSYRGTLPATPTRFETVEWLLVDDAAEDEDGMQSIHSVSLRGHEHDDELAVMINTKQLNDADMQRELCIQLWSHSNDVDAVDLSSDTAPQHDLLVQFTATVPELAQCANPDSTGEWQGKDEEEEERFQQITDFFVSVEVMLHEEGDRRERDKRLELEIAIEQERMRMMQEGRSPSPIPPASPATTATAATAITQRTPSKVRVSTGQSGTSTPQRRPSLTSLTAPTLASAMPSMLDDFHDLIMPDRVFTRRLRQKAEERRRQKKASAAAASGAVATGDGSNSTSPNSRSPNSSLTSSPHHSPSSSRSSSPAPSTRSLNAFTSFEPTYYRVRMTVRDLPKMSFHGSCDSYFHILLSSARDNSQQPSSTTTPPPAGATGSLQSLYRSEVQFNRLNPRFASFVLSSVRDRDRDRLITLRMINWRQRVEEGHEEVIGEVTVPLSSLVPAAASGADSGGRAIEPLTLTLLNPVREFIRMKSASVGVCVLEFEELNASTVSVDTMPSSQLKSVRQLNEGEKRVSKRKEKEREREEEKGDK